VVISPIVRKALKLLRAWLPSSIEILQNIENCVASVDATQIHELLVNLCSNAAHGMDNKGIPGAGSCFVNPSEGDLTDLALVDVKRGPYLKLSVSDFRRWRAMLR